MRMTRSTGRNYRVPAPEPPRADGLPRASPIPPGGKPREGERARCEIGGQFGKQHARNCGIDLVLNSDVRPPARSILRDQQRVEPIGEPGTDRGKLDALDTIGDTPPERDQRRKPGNGSCRATFIAQRVAQFALRRRRQMMKERQMRAQHIAFGRKMRAPQRIGPREVGRAEQGRHDDGCRYSHRHPKIISSD